MRAGTKLHELADVIGWPAVPALARRFGGQRLYIAAHLPASNPIVAVIGSDAAAILSSHYHQTEIYLPVRWRHHLHVRELYQRDPRPTINEIVAETGLSYRAVLDHIKQIDSTNDNLAEPDAPTAQRTIFDILSER